MGQAAKTLQAIRDMIAACEEAGWDTIDGNAEILDRAREAYADLQVVMVDAHEGASE